MKRFFLAAAATTLALTSVACSDTSAPVSQAGNLTAGEVSSLAFGVSALSTTNAEDIAWAGASFNISTPDFNLALHRARGGGGGKGGGGILGLWGPRGFGTHGTTTTSTDRIAPCPQGGTLRSVTTVTAVVDTVAKTGTVTTNAADTPAACAFTVDSLNTALRTIANPNTVITINGTPSLVTESTSGYSWATPAAAGSRGRFARAASTGRQTGSFAYTTSDARTGTCVVDLTTTFDPDVRMHTVTGTFCGQPVDLSSTLPQRGGRH